MNKITGWLGCILTGVLSASLVLPPWMLITFLALVAAPNPARAADSDERLHELFSTVHEVSKTETAVSFVSGGGDGVVVVKMTRKKNGTLGRVKSVLLVFTADGSWFELKLSTSGRPSKIIDSSGNKTIIKRFSARKGTAVVQGVGPKGKKLAKAQRISLPGELLEFSKFAKRLSRVPSVSEEQANRFARGGGDTAKLDVVQKALIGTVMAKFTLDAMSAAALSLGILTLAGTGWVPLIAASAIGSGGILLSGFTALDKLSSGQLGKLLPGVKDLADEYGEVMDVLGWAQAVNGLLKKSIKELGEQLTGKLLEKAIEVGEENGALITGSFQAILESAGSSYRVRVNGVLTHTLVISISGTDGFYTTYSGLGSVTTGVIPTGAGGVTDTITVRDDVTGEVKELVFTF